MLSAPPIPPSLHAGADLVQHTMKLVLTEANTAAQLMQLGLRPTVVSALLTTAPPPPVRIDARSLESATLWLSDLSAPNLEGGFKTWPSDLSSALKKGLRGARQFTRHNLFTAIFAFDPATMHGARTASYVATILKRSAPLRIGVLARSADGNGDSNLATRALACTCMLMAPDCAPLPPSLIR